jgi:ribokinase
MRKPILVVGSVNLDLAVSVPRLPAPGETVNGGVFHTFFGGKGANQAVGVARLNYPVSIIAKLGDDDIGKSLHMGLHGAGVGTQAVGVARRTSSGIALVATVTGGRTA